MFQPQLGNVVFASAHDGWAFRPAQFAALYAAKLGANPAALSKASLHGRSTLKPSWLSTCSGRVQVNFDHAVSIADQQQRL